MWLLEINTKFQKTERIDPSRIGRKVHISNNTMSHIEVGSNKSETITLAVYNANALGVSMDMLLCDSLYVSGVSYDNYTNETLKECTDDEIRFINQFFPGLLIILLPKEWDVDKYGSKFTS